MTIEVIGFVTLGFGLIGLFLEPTFIVYVFVASTLLGSAGAVILTSLGGTTIQPAHLLLGFLTVRLLIDRDIRNGAVRAVTVGRPGFWLLVTMIYSLVSAYVMPRLFLGQTMTFAVRAMGENFAAPLAPSTSNLTQSIYFTGDFVCFVLLWGFANTDAGCKNLARAGLTCVILNLVFVALDLGTYLTNTTELLSYIRNATYATMAEADVAGIKRIVGSFVEASSFGYWTLGYFAFVLSLWLSGISKRLTLSLSVLSLVALIFSTSSTAYVGLAVFLFVQYALIGGRLLSGKVGRQMAFFMMAAPFAVCMIAILIALNDSAAGYVGNLFDQLVFNKMSSASGVERFNWNSQGVQNFFDTFGFGAGNGSVRTSSFPIAVIASIGIFGAITYSLFLVMIWFYRSGPVEQPMAAVQTAAKWACFAWIIAATVSVGFIDLGLPFFAFAALASADPKTSKLRAPNPYSPLARIAAPAQT